MSDFEAVLFAFAAGLTFCGAAGSLVELVSGRTLSLKGGLVSREHLLRSFAIVAATGPFMLIADLLSERRTGPVAFPRIASVLVAAGAWFLAAGVLVFDLALTVCRF